MEHTDALTIELETSTLSNKAIFKLLYLIPLFFIFTLLSFPFFTIIGLLHAFYILFTGKTNKFLVNLLLKVEHWNLILLANMLYIQSEFSILKEVIIITDYEVELVVSRTESFFRFFAIPVIFIWYLFFYFGLISFSLTLSLNILQNKPIKLKNVTLDMKEYFHLINYLCHAIESRIYWKYANKGVFFPLLFLIFFDFFVFRNANFLFHNSFYVPVLYLLIFVFYFLFIIPNYLSSPASNQEDYSGKEIRKQIGIILPKKTGVDVIISFLIIVFQLALIYGFSLLFLFSTNDLFFGSEFLHYSIIRGLYPGITEEILFRGYVFNILKKKFSVNKSILISSLLFGLYHLVSSLPTIEWPNIVQMIHTAFIGVMFCVFRVASNSLLGPIVMHSLYDIVLFSLLLLDPFPIPAYFYTVYYLIVIIINFSIMLISIYLLKNIYNRPDILSFRKKTVEAQVEPT
jgi:membrane protease YdiL (CAAX protease family)